MHTERGRAGSKKASWAEQERSEPAVDNGLRTQSWYVRQSKTAPVFVWTQAIVISRYLAMLGGCSSVASGSDRAAEHTETRWSLCRSC